MKSPYSLDYLKSLQPADWSQITGAELRATYQQVKELLHKREKTFRKHGETAPHAGLPSSRGMSEGQMRANIKSALAYMRGRRSTYQGYSKSEQERKAKIEAKLYDKYKLKLNTREEWREFSKFMDEMHDRYGKMNDWVSGTAVRIYAQAFRLGGDPKQFMKNYDYWEAHIKDLEKAEPVNRKSATPPKPSYFARKLGLEKINAWKSENKQWSIDD